MQHDRTALKQRDDVVTVARHLSEGLLLIVVSGTFRHRVELAHGVGDARFFERPARPEVADLALSKRRNPVEGADPDRGIGIDRHKYRILAEFRQMARYRWQR